MPDIANYMFKKSEQINRKLAEILPAVPQEAQVLKDSMEYSLLAGGKRLRPIFFLTTLEALGKDSKPFLPFACALEMIHTFSLIHDDLPAMDNDDYRRGKPTCHKMFGEAQAILAGDGLLTHAFAIMTQASQWAPPALVLQAINEVSLATGLDGMIVGQVVDVARDGEELDLAELRFINKYKTGALFRSAVRSAAILAEASEAQLTALTAFAEQFGLAFQIVDDILDVIGDTKITGKTSGSDAKNHKITYPSLLGLESAQRQAAKATRQAIAHLASLGEAGDRLAQITVELLNRNF